MLSIGTTLFRDILFEPRNRAVHQYEAVELKAAKQAFELARLFVRNTQQMQSPGRSNVFYGPLDIARGDEAHRRAGKLEKKKRRKKDNEVQHMYFEGLGPIGSRGVFLCRSSSPKIALLESGGDGDIEVRFTPLNKFTPILLREVLATLEASTPSPYDLKLIEEEHILKSFSALLEENGPPYFAESAAYFDLEPQFMPSS